MRINFFRGESMDNIDELFKKIVDRINRYNAKADFMMLEKAYKLSREAHEEQMRASGEPFIIHPLEVAYILADLELDISTIIAGLLHDVVEDTVYSCDQIKDMFNDEVASLVDGVTKLEKIPYTSKKEQHVENLRKMFLAMAKDIRVIIVKLADRLHNMRTLKYKPKETQIEKAQEVMEIYAPLAHRLGMSKIKCELEDHALRYIDPEGYYDLVDKIAIRKKEREEFIKNIIETLKEKIRELEIKSSVDGRPKHFYSIYKKMKTQNKGIDQIYDLFAVRIIVDTVQDCYAVLGLVHELYKPLPGRFKDYIAMPKPNMYQSLHTTLIGPEGHPFEVQIRTWDMHRIAEAGIAAHWKYKEGGQTDDDADSKFAWLRQLLEWQKELRDEDQFLENLKINLFIDEVFVFTPKGDVFDLPAGSTPIDFAYAVHSGVGNKMMGSKINGKIVPIDYTLKNGDIIEILTASNVHGPSRDWLKIAKSSQARNKINQWFKKEKKEENIIRGKELLERELKKTGFQHSQLFKPEWIEIALKKYSLNSTDDMYAGIGYGAILPQNLISRLKEEYRKAIKETETEIVNIPDINPPKSRKKTMLPSGGIIVKGIDNCLIRFSKCCSPVPGDEIVGYITRGRGVSIHRKDCINLVSSDEEKNRLIEVEWYKEPGVSYLAEIQLMANDRNVLLMEITNCMANIKVAIKAVNAKTTRDRIAIISLTMEITGVDQLEKIIEKLRRIEGVFEVSRAGRA